MNTIKGLILVAIFALTSTFAHANTEPTKAEAELQAQVNELLMKSNVMNNVDNEETIMVRFMVTKDSEILVLSTDNKDFDSTMKSILNYQEVVVDKTLQNEIFFLPVRLTKK